MGILKKMNNANFKAGGTAPLWAAQPPATPEPGQDEVAETPEAEAVETSEEPAAAADADAPGAQEDLGKVREILVGGFIREQRLERARLEEKIIQQATYMREDLAKHATSLERLVHDKTGAALEAGHTEANSRKIGDEMLGKRLEELRTHAEQKLADIEERANRAENELRDQLLSQCKLLSNTIDQRHEEVVNLLRDGLAEVKSRKVDRDALGEMLAEVAHRFQGTTD